MKRYEVIGVEGLPEIGRGDDLAGFIHETARRQQTPLESRDILVVSQKIVSKTEGRLVRLSEVTPSARAQALALELGRDPKLTEVILSESRRVVRGDKGVLIVETHHGWICANAGVDQSNVDADTACLLPEDSDRSARAMRDRLRQLTGHELGIIIADTFGRPWREGLINVAVGVAGLMPLKSYLGRARSRRPRAAGHDPGAGRRAGERRRAGDGQARPHSRRHHPRPRLGGGRGRQPAAHPRPGPRSLPLTSTHL